MGGKRHKGCGGEFIPSYIHDDMRCSKCWSPYEGVRPGRRRRSRLPVTLAITLMAVAVIGAVWYFDMSPVDIGGTILDGIGEAAEYGSVALEGAADIASEGSIVLDDLGDAARDAADIVEESVVEPALESVVEPTVELAEPAIDAVVDQVDGLTADIPDTAPPSPFDRTIWPDETAHGSGQDVRAEPTPPATVEYDMEAAAISTAPETVIPKVTETSLTQLDSLKAQMLELINENRDFVGLDPVALGNNSAAQTHAEDMKQNCYMAHWGLDGLKPDMRYVLAGGQQYNAENVSGHLSCVGSNYATVSAERQLRESMDGLMRSPGHRDNILDPHHAAVNLGIAYDSRSMWVVQQFEYDYVSFIEPPSLANGVLSFEGTVTNGANIHSEDDLAVSVYYSQYPREWTREEVNRTYCYDAGDPAAFVRPAAPPGSYYTSDGTVVTDYGGCPGPEDASTSNAIQVRTHAVLWYDAKVWYVGGQTFKVSVNLADVLRENGDGVYTVLIWASGDVQIASYPILYEAAGS